MLFRCARHYAAGPLPSNSFLGYFLAHYMAVSFAWRKTQPRDLPECLKLHPAKNGAEIVGHARALKAWLQLLQTTHATRSALVEMHSSGRTEIVGFGLGTFVKKSFADAEIREPRPGLNARIIESVVAGNPVIATYAEVRDANTRGDLQHVVLETSWKASLEASQISEVRALLGAAHIELFAGYRLARAFTEFVDELDISQREQGIDEFRVVDRFEDFRRQNPKSIWNPERMLLEVTLDRVRAYPHSVGARLFMHHIPQFGFTRGEQEILELALEGSDDAAMAKSLFVTVPAIKRRWTTIFERVGRIQPDLCPLDGEGTRGVQKRQRVLTYVRSHPEELRPFDAKQLK